MTVFVLIIALNLMTKAWGFEPHRQINFHAVFLLPEPLYSFYRKHIDEITILATKADQRRYIVQDESAKHYLDLDHYESLPLDTIRLTWDSAVVRFTEDSLRTHGILPWNLIWTFAKLVNAFKAKDRDRIIRTSADLGHYIADAHVPLHTTSNYNGQLTGQKGIHGLWETRLPKLFFEQYNLLLPDAIELSDLDSLIWLSIEESHALTRSVLDQELDASAQFESKFGYEGSKKVYHRDFCDHYHTAMAGMVETRLQLAIYRLSCLWYTAWIKAGRPMDWTDPSESFIISDTASVIEKVTGRDSLH